jgi:hypothetical protein
LAIMFATNSVAEILGLEPSDLQNKSFYECIDDNCLDDAMECIEAAKANDSIAYLRFWSRDARREDDLVDEESEADEDLSGDTLAGGSSGAGEGNSGSASVTCDSTSRRDSSDSEQGGVRLDAAMDLDSPFQSASPMKRESLSQEPEGARITSEGPASGGNNSNQESAAQSSASENETTRRENRRNVRSRSGQQRRPYPVPSAEIEAFMSCTSDGLVVILRRARQLPSAAAGPSAAELGRQGVFAAPWAPEPVAAHYGRPTRHESQVPHASGSHHQPQQVPVQHEAQATGGPPMDELMASIQEVAVFAWALVGINRSLSTYGHGNPTGNAQPPEDQYYSDKSSGSEMPAYVTSGQGDQAQASPWGASSQQPPNGFVVSDKGQPVEPRYTSYPEQGANQLRSNGPWSNGNGTWRGQTQFPNGQHGNVLMQQQTGGFQNGTAWGQNANGQHGANGSGHQSTY